jgi:negative regulator of flagellin synthesis FlgM
MKVNNKPSTALMNDRAISDMKDLGVKRTKHDAVKGKMETSDATKLHLSPQAKQIAKATDIAKDQSVNEAKIARLQKMIDGGEYKVDADAVAEKLLNEHLTIGE